MKVEFKRESEVKKSFNVEATAGMFDLDLDAKLSNEWSVELPDVDDDWQIGVIVGPSGSGKTSVAREAFGGFGGGLFEQVGYREQTKPHHPFSSTVFKIRNTLAIINSQPSLLRAIWCPSDVACVSFKSLLTAINARPFFGKIRCQSRTQT